MTIKINGEEITATGKMLLEIESVYWRAAANGKGDYDKKTAELVEKACLIHDQLVRKNYYYQLAWQERQSKWKHS